MMAVDQSDLCVAVPGCVEELLRATRDASVSGFSRLIGRRRNAGPFRVKRRKLRHARATGPVIRML